MKVGIVGASGYSGEVLVEILARHPRAELAAVTSRQHAGKPVGEVLPRLRGRAGALVFSASEPAELAAREDIAVWFLALPHGVAAQFARPLVEAGRRVLDLSADFRTSSPERYAEFYGQPHPDPALLQRAAYVLPEWHPVETWRDRPLLACPGCYPTSVILPLAPLLRAGLVDPDRIVANSLSGVSGAGKQAKEFYSYCERQESLTAYGMPKHRHLSEIEEQLGRAVGRPLVVQFNPHLVPMRRGILTTITVPGAPGASLEAVREAWRAAFEGRPFVGLLPPGTWPDTALVTGTNRVEISAQHDPRTGNFLLCSAIDNLVKGASGQAVQIFNLAGGFAETDGLL